MNKRTDTIPTAAASHAAFVACHAARDARQLGASEAQAADVYATAYAAAMHEGATA